MQIKYLDVEYSRQREEQVQSPEVYLNKVREL